MEFKGEYHGMPITLNGVIVPLVYFLKMPFDYYPYLYLILSILMISSLRVKKL